ncbi:conserved hypothetical protein [Ricinus communis]|uniref:Retrotransposon gag domain-containing protein n=1 Tax=Ricinus communis TaxID=3988 RepID=B9RWN5_RICCO|nr:conserved hypothetical protein [Ricinus communis]
MTRKAKNSRKSLQFSSRHDYSESTSPSQSPYDSNDDDDEIEDDDEEQPIISESVTNSLNADQLSSSSYSNSQPNNSYINVAPLPVFHGNSNECPIAHLSRFVKVCRANNASSTDMMMRIFPVTLENEAALWYDLNIQPYPSLSWDEIMLSFLEAYQRIKLVDQLRSDLMMLNQGSDESVRSYFMRLQWILKRWPDHGLSDNMLKWIFIDGLMGNFKDWIIPHKPNSLNEALRLAFSFEQVKSIRGTKQKVVKCGFCEGSHEENCCVVREKMRELFRNSKKKMMIPKEASERSEAGNEMAENKDGKEGEEEEEVDVGDDKEEKRMLSSSKTGKSPCQCSKHHCWMKKFERSNSVTTRNSAAE